MKKAVIIAGIGYLSVVSAKASALENALSYEIPEISASDFKNFEVKLVKKTPKLRKENCDKPEEKEKLQRVYEEKHQKVEEPEKSEPSYERKEKSVKKGEYEDQKEDKKEVERSERQEKSENQEEREKSGKKEVEKRETVDKSEKAEEREKSEKKDKKSESKAVIINKREKDERVNAEEKESEKETKQEEKVKTKSLKGSKSNTEQESKSVKFNKDKNEEYDIEKQLHERAKEMTKSRHAEAKAKDFRDSLEDFGLSASGMSHDEGEMMLGYEGKGSKKLLTNLDVMEEDIVHEEIVRDRNCNEKVNKKIWKKKHENRKHVGECSNRVSNKKAIKGKGKGKGAYLKKQKLNGKGARFLVHKDESHKQLCKETKDSKIDIEKDHHKNLSVAKSEEKTEDSDKVFAFNENAKKVFIDEEERSNDDKKDINIHKENSTGVMTN